MNTKEKIVLMQAFLDGQPVEYKHRDPEVYDTWDDLSCVNPTWNWATYEYRIAPAAPDEIDWSHVADKYRFMARDSDGTVWLYMERPSISGGCWSYNIGIVPADYFASYKRGTVDWKDSLVERPK